MYAQILLKIMDVYTEFLKLMHFHQILLRKTYRYAAYLYLYI